LSKRTGIATLVWCVLTSATAAPGDSLRVTGGVVNLRAGPSTDHRVVAQLQRDDRVTEMERRSNWVRIRFDQPDGDSAWIYAALVEPAPPSRSSTAVPSDQPKAEAPAPSAAFKAFRAEFQRFNDTMREALGSPYFDHAEHLGDGRIRVTATQQWLAEDETNRRRKARTVLYMWQAAQDRRREVAVEIVDERGQARMRLPR